MSGRQCEVVTGVTIGLFLSLAWLSQRSNSVIPTVEAPGYKLQSISCSTLVQFYENTVSFTTPVRRESADSQPQMIKAYVESGEGEDRAGGFAIQVSFILRPIETS
jgi:septum formation protein